MIKRITEKRIAAIAAAVILMVITVCPAIASDSMELKIVSDRTGNIFGSEDDAVININIKNTSQTYDAQVSRTVYDYDGNIVLQEEDSMRINANSSTTIPVDISELGYGLYSMAVEINAQTVYGIMESVSKTETIYFSKILSSEKGESNSSFGFATHIDTHNNVSQTMELVEKCGAGAGIRDGRSWASCGAQKESFNIGSAWEEFVNYADGGNVIMLGYGNTQAVEQTDVDGNAAEASNLRAPKTEADLEAWGEYCSFVAEQTRGTAEYYEVWNEFDGRFNIDRLDGSYYKKILKVAYEAVTDVNPDAKIIALGGTGTTDRNWQNFISEVFTPGEEDDGWRYCDAISIHPYNKITQFPNADWIEKFRWYSDYMIENYGFKKPVICTEVGWTTAIEDTVTTNKPMVDEITQAKSLAEVYTLAKAYDIGDKIYWYDFQDDGADLTNAEMCFGVVTNSDDEKGGLVAKPSYVTAAAMNNLLGDDLTFSQKSESSDYTKCAYCFKNISGDTVGTVWGTNAGDSVSLELDDNYITVYDMYGNEVETLSLSEDGTYTINVGSELFFIRGSEYSGPTDIEAFSVETDNSARRVTISGRIANSRSNEKATIMVLPHGDETISERNIVYVNEAEVTDGEFRHTFTILENEFDDDYDIYVCSTNTKEKKSENSGFNIFKAAEFTLSDEDLLVASAVVKNTTDLSKTASIFIAQYDEGGSLVQVKQENTEVARGDKTVSMTDTKNKDAAGYSAYIWSLDEGIRPLFGKVSIGR